MNDLMKENRSIIDLMILVMVVCLTTFMGILFVKAGFPETNIVVIYILAVLLVARFTNGYIYGILASIFCLLCFNYFFTQPYHTLEVNDPSYMITFAIMLITAFITSALTTKEKLMTKEATRKGMENQILYQLSSRLSDAADIDEVIAIAASSMKELLQVNVGCIYVGEQAKPIYIQQLEDQQIHRSVNDVDKLRQRFTDLRDEYLKDDEYYSYPVNGQNSLLAIIMIDNKVNEEELNTNKRLIHSMIENISLTLERIEITIERVKDKQRIEKEQERANLLRSISHDLRTPLSAIMGSCEILMDMTKNNQDSLKLVKGIYQDADWLKSLVENILSLTRLQDGKILVHKEMEALEEVIGSAVTHIEKMNPEREIQVDIPDDFVLVPMDAKLIEQVITNLLDNAIKHTTSKQEIMVSVSYNDKEAIVSVLDEGEGIADIDENKIFQIFYTSKAKSSDAKKGIGLGLTICETVIKAHGGTISGKNRTDRKGAQFVFTLPLDNKGENA